MQPFEESEVALLEDVVETEVHNLVVFNDDVNSFDQVIDTLMDV